MKQFLHVYSIFRYVLEFDYLFMCMHIFTMFNVYICINSHRDRSV